MLWVWRAMLRSLQDIFRPTLSEFSGCAPAIDVPVLTYLFVYSSEFQAKSISSATSALAVSPQTTAMHTRLLRTVLTEWFIWTARSGGQLMTGASKSWTRLKIPRGSTGDADSTIFSCIT